MLYIVGFGPGGYEFMTIEAIRALEASEIIIGYQAYVELIQPYFPGKAFFYTGMRQERQRCEKAVEEAAKGKNVALVCSGDSGVYGMAGLLYELLDAEDKIWQEVYAVAGVTAALSGGAVLGAPLSNDFMVVSLSDLLTPWEQIAKRIRCAAMSDTVLCLYNPGSRGRREHLKRACDLVLEYQPPDLTCGYVKNIGRDAQSACVLSLRELREVEVDMFTTVWIGNRTTINKGGRMITPRGYRNE